MKTFLIGWLAGILTAYLFSIRAKWLPLAKSEIEKVETKISKGKGA